jgi:hypothetical protein
MAAIAALAVMSAVSALAEAVTLNWTAPGEDSLVGTAARYDLRCSVQMITPASFAQSRLIAGLPRPGPPGTSQSVTIAGLQSGLVYYFAIKSADVAGNWSAMSNVAVRTPQAVTGIDDLAALACSAPWPNPARASTRFEIVLPSPMRVRLEVFDVAGRRVRGLMDESRDAGTANLDFDLRDDGGARLAQGIYLVRARLGESVFMRRLVVTR